MENVFSKRPPPAIIDEEVRRLLRALFDEPPRQDEGRIRQVLEVMKQVAAQYDRNRRQSGSGRDVERELRLMVWIKSLTTSFDELEQSVYGAGHYADRVRSRYVEQMSGEERLNYRRHLYFYKNGFIRTFSVLDKLGSFMNDRFSLRTERIKERYSYFTVLRTMNYAKPLNLLCGRLNEIKRKYQEPMLDLRLMRNHEIHAINTELLDEDGKIRLRSADGNVPVEDLHRNMVMLEDGFKMVCESMVAVMQYCKNND